MLVETEIQPQKYFFIVNNFVISNNNNKKKAISLKKVLKIEFQDSIKVSSVSVDREFVQRRKIFRHRESLWVELSIGKSDRTEKLDETK